MKTIVQWIFFVMVVTFSFGAQSAAAQMEYPGWTIPSKNKHHFVARMFSNRSWQGSIFVVSRNRTPSSDATGYVVKWVCENYMCYGIDLRGRRSDMDDIIQTCSRLANKIGGLSSYKSRWQRHTDGGNQTMAKCNSGVKVGKARKYYYEAEIKDYEREAVMRDSKHGIRWYCRARKCWAEIAGRYPNWEHCRQLKKKTSKISRFRKFNPNDTRPRDKWAPVWQSLVRGNLRKCNGDTPSAACGMRMFGGSKKCD